MLEHFVIMTELHHRCLIKFQKHFRDLPLITDNPLQEEIF